MRITVCLKAVPATTADIRVAPDGKSLQLSGVEQIVSPYDEFAMEAALKLREQFAGSHIHAFSAGGDEANAKCLFHAFSLGADSGTHVKAPGIDARAAAHCAAAVLQATPSDLVLCGRQAIDDDQWFFPGAVAELLNLPHVTAVSALTLAADRKSATCKRRVDGAELTVQVQLPAVISCDKGLNEPRAASLKGRLDAKKKTAEVKTPAELGVKDTPAMAVAQFLPPPQKSPGKVLTSAPADAAKELVRLLRDEAKVI
jgi:electron transfer flavoprotein beta subunit